MSSRYGRAQGELNVNFTDHINDRYVFSVAQKSALEQLSLGWEELSKWLIILRSNPLAERERDQQRCKIEKALTALFDA